MASDTVIFSLFNDSFSNSDNSVAGSYHSLCWYLPGGTSNTTKTSLNSVPPDKTAEVSLLEPTCLLKLHALETATILGRRKKE
jgi:hypothetical protein